jgi:hypothetical protein
MQKLFDTAVDYPLALAPANEEFPRARALDSGPLEHSSGMGWSAFEIWHSRIRPSPGVTSILLPRR